MVAAAVGAIGTPTASAADGATAYQLPSASAFPAGLTAGPDGNLWFTEIFGNKIGRITPTGEITEFPIPTPDSRPVGITVGPDGNLWFTESKAAKIGRITPAGAITEYTGIIAGGQPIGIVAGPDGKLWFTEGGYNEGNRIGRISPTTGVIQQFCIRGCDLMPYPPDYGLHPSGITVGPDGRIWFAMENPGSSESGPYDDAGTPLVAAASTAGKITEYPLLTENAQPSGIAKGPDGNLWVTESMAGKIARVSPSGQVAEFPLPNSSSYPANIISAPRGELWFTEYFGERIGSMTTAGAVAEVPKVPDAHANLNQVVVGPDGQLWATESRYGKIWRFTVESAKASAPPEPTSEPEPTPEPAVAPDGTATANIVLGRSIAGVRLDMLAPTVRARLGEPDAVSRVRTRFGRAIRYSYRQRRLAVFLYTGTHRVFRVRSRSAAERTRHNLGVGSTDRQVRRALKRETCGPGRPPRYCFVGSETQTVFRFKDRRVSSVAVTVAALRQ